MTKNRFSHMTDEELKLYAEATPEECEALAAMAIERGVIAYPEDDEQE